MIRIPLLFIAGLFSLALAAAVQYTPILFVDFTQTPETIQVLASMSFVMLFSVCMIYIGVVVYEQ